MQYDDARYVHIVAQCVDGRLVEHWLVHGCSEVVARWGGDEAVECIDAVNEANHTANAIERRCERKQRTCDERRELSESMAAR